MCLTVFACVSFLFFFSSRRRHTRSDRDWSSDVCSSDLFGLLVRPTAHRSGLSDIAALSEFTPELGCVVASLFPALLQIFAVAVQLTCALNRHAFREAASADPATNCAPIKAEGVSNLCFRAAFP